MIGVGLGDLAGAAADVAKMFGALAGAAAVVTRYTMANRNGTHRAMHGFLEGHHDVALDVAPALRIIIQIAAGKAASATASCGAKKLLEKLAETGAAELKLEFLPAPPSAREGTAAGESFPPRRRAKLTERERRLRAQVA